MKEDGGFEYGMDAVTPQRFVFTTLSRARAGAYRSWKLPPELVNSADFQAWARGMNGELVISLRELQKKMKVFL